MAELKRRNVLQGAVALGVGTLTVGCNPDLGIGSPGSPGNSSGAPVIAVDTRKSLAKVSRFITGVNGAKWYDDAYGMWDSKKNAPVPAGVSQVKRSGIAMVRYPGGTSANLFNWKNAVGPQNQRGGQLEGKKGAPVDSRYGPDEYMAFTKAIGGEPQIMAPFANSTPQEIADWVAYMNAPEHTEFGRLRAKNGHPEPYGVHYWEIGNELFGKHQRYWMSDDDETAMRQYAFGGTQRQMNQPIGKPTDHRPSAAVSSGEPHQSFTVWYPPVVPKSQMVHINRMKWHQVDDLSSAGPKQRVYTFEPKSGTICFGDGHHGKIPPKGAKITANYESGPHAGFVDYYKAMKEVDPTISVLSVWALIGSGKLAGGTSFPQLLAEHGHADHFDGMSIHPYTNFQRDLHVKRFPDKRAGHDYQMIGEKAAGGMVEDLQHEVRKYGKRGAYVAVSECGALFFGKSDKKAYPQYAYAMSHALYISSQWARFSALGVPWTASNDLIPPKEGISREVLTGAPDFGQTPDAIVREQLRDVFHGGGRVVESGVQNNIAVSTRETALGNSYDALVTMATVDADNKLNIVVINRSPDKDIKAKIVTEHFKCSGTAEVSVVSGDAYDDFDDDKQNSRSVKIEKSHASPKSDALNMAFRAHSVTLIRLNGS
ncbi:hypothetical protein [Streptomyces sp. NPDC054786]